MDTVLSPLPGPEPSLAPWRGGGVPARRGDVEAAPSSLAGATLPATADVASLAGGGFAGLQSRQDDLNSLARGIREAGRIVEIRKLFPPYPPGQAERMAYLDSLSGLRKQIEAMLPGAETPEAELERLAEGLGRDGRRLLADLPRHQALGGNRPLLEVVAQGGPHT